MAITPTVYATAAEYRAALSGTDASQDASILADLTTISRYIDSVCNRFFGADSAAVARVFTAPVNYRALIVGDMAAVPTGVLIDTDNDGSFTGETAVTGFEAWPLNAALDPEPRPYYMIGLPSWASPSAFTAGSRVQVTAKWGWPAVPAAIKAATIHLTGILRLQSPRATVRMDEMGSPIQMSGEAQHIVRNLLREYALVEVPSGRPVA